MKTMKAAVFEGVGSFVLREVPVPRLERDDQVKLRVEAASICGTDVHITAVPPGYPATPGTILGHELVGAVVEAGPAVTHLKTGDRVVVNPNNYCGVCAYCRKNLPNLCQNLEALGIDYNGGFAEYCVVSAKVAYRIGGSVPPEAAACAEPLACAVNGLKKIRVLPGETAVVVGGGPIGLMIAMLLRASGAGSCILLETSDYRCDFAARLGVAQVVNPKKQDAAAAVAEATGIGADCVFDVTGSQLTASVDYVRKGGRVVLFGVNGQAVSRLAQKNITQKEIQVLGTWLANATFPEAVRMLEERSIDILPLVTHVLPLEDIAMGLELLSRGEAVKVILKP